MYDLMSSATLPNPMSPNNNTSSNVFTNSGTNSTNGTLQHLKQTNPKAAKILADYKQIILELRAQNFDVIRFATYRTASKLRFIQKKLNLHLIDLWNVIESFRDNNIHTLDILQEIETKKIESCVQNMYIELNKRLAFNQHINVETQTQLLTAWLLNLFDKNRLSRVKVISFKVALTTMCAGKLTDKIKYIFNQISDPSKNSLIIPKFELYLKELLTLPTSVFEEPSFGYNESISKSCFDLSQPIRLNDFLNVALSDLGPACFIWLNIFHRFTVVQNVQHPVSCSVCQRSHFNGFRYKCQKCRKYQLCQDCFWRGRVSNSHQLSHQMKEYTSYKSAAKQFSNTIKKSFFCKPANKQNRHQMQQQQTQQERQSLLLQKPVEIHQLSYQKQYDYEKSLAQNNYLNEKQDLAAKSTSIENSSDYNLLYRSEPKAAVYNNSGLGEMGNCSASNTLNRTTKKSINSSTSTNNLGLNDSHCYSNDSTKLAHIIPPPSSQYFQQEGQGIYQASSLKKSLKHNQQQQSYSAQNTPMTKAKQLDSLNCPNILAKFLLANNTLSSNENLTQDEHSIIANYSSQLSEFYTKNPHLASSPTSCTSTSPAQHLKLKPNIKPKPTADSISHYRSSMQYENPRLSHPINQGRTASLQRPTTSSHRMTPKGNAFYNDTYGGGVGSNTLAKSTGLKNHIIPQNTTRSLSESNFRTNCDLDGFDGEQGQDDTLLREKREIVLKLEKQNKDIINEINRLKQHQLSNKSLDKTEQRDAWMLQQALLTKLKSQRETIPTLASTLTRHKTNNNTSSSNTLNTQHDSILVNSFINQNPHLISLLTKLTSSGACNDPHIVAELQTLRNRKGMLENRMAALENSRDELIGRLTQLDGSGQYVKYESPVLGKKKFMNNSHSLRTTPVNSPRPGHRYTNNNDENGSPSYMNQSNLSASTFIPIVSASMAMQMPVAGQQYQQQSTPNRSGIITNINRGGSTTSLYTQPRSWSTPTTPALNEIHPGRQANKSTNNNNNNNNNNMPFSASSLVSLNGASSNASLYSNSSNCNSLNKTSNLNNLRNDLLIAADSVTNAMQGLVRELNSENESMFDEDENFDAKQTNWDGLEHGSQIPDLETSAVLNKQNFSIEHSNRPYQNSQSNTPVLFRRQLQEAANQKLSKQLNNDCSDSKINMTGYRNGVNLDNYNIDISQQEQSNGTDYEADDDEANYQAPDNFIDGYTMNKINFSDQQNIEFEQTLQLQYEMQNQDQLEQQQDIEFERKLAENLATNTNDQMASWRRELEQRLTPGNQGNIETPVEINNNLQSQTNLNDKETDQQNK